MTRTCNACGGRVRSGTGRLAQLVDRDGVGTSIRTGIVCARCASRGVLIVSVAPVEVAPACACGRGTALVCGPCFDRQAEHAKELSAANVVLKQIKVPT